MKHQQPITDHRPTHLGQQGLTLLEVLITLVILAVMGVIALEAFRIGHRSWERGERRAEAEQRIRVVYGMLSHELASLRPVTAELDGKRVMAFQGSQDRVFFYSAPDGYVSFPYNGMVRGLSFFVERGKGLVVQEGYPLIEGQVSLDPGGAIKVVDPHVTRIRFRYLAAPSRDEIGPQWVEVWDPVEVSESTRRRVRARTARQRRGERAQRSGLPLAVAVQVTIADERGERALDFLLPIPLAHEL